VFFEFRVYKAFVHTEFKEHGIIICRFEVQLRWIVMLEVASNNLGVGNWLLKAASKDLSTGNWLLKSNCEAIENRGL
jgi:hypothetical protein